MALCRNTPNEALVGLQYRLQEKNHCAARGLCINLQLDITV